MIKSAIKIVVLVIAVVGGGFAGSFVKNMSAGGASDANVSSEKDGKASSDKSDKSKKDKKGGKGDDKISKNVSYLKFKRQFIVPVTEGGKIKSLMIMNLNIELDKDAPDNSFSYEPKLRDAFMRDLLTLSNEGVLSGDLTAPETYETIRETLIGSSRRVLKKGVSDVLILDLAKRDTA